MKDEYQDQVKDFVQDQRLADIIADETAEDAQAAAIESQLDGAKAKLLAGLSQYKPPPGADPEDYASMRADVEALISRYHPVPGQTAEEALAELRYQYQSRVRDLAQEMKIDKVAEDLTQEDTAANATTTVAEGSTTITYGPAYYDRATNPPRPNVTENDDGTRTVTFVNEQGRQVTIKTAETPEAAIVKYKDHMPAPPEAPEHSPEQGGFLRDILDRHNLVKWGQDAANADQPAVMDLAHRIGLPRIDEIHQAAVQPAAPDDQQGYDGSGINPQGMYDSSGIKVAPAPTDEVDAGPDPRVTMPMNVATAADDDVVGDDDAGDDFRPSGFEPKTRGDIDAGADKSVDSDDAKKDDEFAFATASHERDGVNAADDVDKAFATDDHDDDPFAIKHDDSADEFDSSGGGSSDDNMDPMLG
jgi:hypothetical protein